MPPDGGLQSGRSGTSRPAATSVRPQGFGRDGEAAAGLVAGDGVRPGNPGFAAYAWANMALDIGANAAKGEMKWGWGRLMRAEAAGRLSPRR